MRHLLDRFRNASPIAREGIVFSLALFAGITLLPLAVWLVGARLLGPYTNGGYLRFWGDFFVGLASGGLAWWLLALGPYLLLLFFRLIRRAVRVPREV